MDETSQVNPLSQPSGLSLSNRTMEHFFLPVHLLTMTPVHVARDRMTSAAVAPTRKPVPSATEHADIGGLRLELSSPLAETQPDRIFSRLKRTQNPRLLLEPPVAHARNPQVLLKLEKWSEGLYWNGAPVRLADEIRKQFADIQTGLWVECECKYREEGLETPVSPRFD